MKALLFKPFEKYSENKLLLFGVLFSLVGICLAYLFHARFDGVLDTHFVNRVQWKEPILDFLIDVVSLFLLLCIAAKLVNNKTRLIDILVTVLISRVPFIVLPLFNINDKLYLISKVVEENVLKLGKNSASLPIDAGSMIYLIFSGLIALLFVVWSVALLYNGYKVSSNAKGGKAIVLFIVSIVLAEVLSKYLIYQLY